MAYGKGVRVAKCPIGQEYCDLSGYFSKGNRCVRRQRLWHNLTMDTLAR